MIDNGSTTPAHLTYEKHTGEAGYLLLSVLVLVVFLLLTLSVAAPMVATDLRRDKEGELYHRGLQYARAIRLYYKRFGKYPPSLDALENTNGQRFLRKRYKDPITGADFRLIHVGEAKVPVPGWYGNLPGSTNNSGAPIASTPVGNGFSGPGSPGAGPTAGFGASPTPGSSPGFGSSSANPSNGSFGTPSSSFGTPNSSFGTPNSSFGTPNSSFGTPNSSFGTPANGSPGTQTSTDGTSAFGTTGTDGQGSSGSNSTGTGTTGQTLGGSIVGVSSSSTKKSIRLYRKQTHYNEWEFVYDASKEVLGATGIGPMQPSGQPNLNNPGGPNSIGAPNSPAGTFGSSPAPTSALPNQPASQQ